MLDDWACRYELDQDSTHTSWVQERNEGPVQSWPWLRIYGPQVGGASARERIVNVVDLEGNVVQAAASALEVRGNGASAGACRPRCNKLDLPLAELQCSCFNPLFGQIPVDGYHAPCKLLPLGEGVGQNGHGNANVMQPCLAQDWSQLAGGICHDAFEVGASSAAASVGSGSGRSSTSSSSSPSSTSRSSSAMASRSRCPLYSDSKRRASSYA